MKFLTQKKKAKIAKNIIKLGFTEQDIIDAADSILDKLTVYQLTGNHDDKTKEEREKGKKGKVEKASYQRGKEQVKGKKQKG